MQPLAGVVFALDGVLIGAGDVRYLRNLTIVAALGGFLPAIWLALRVRPGLGGVWAGLTLFIVLRLVGTAARLRSGRWAVVGAPADAGAARRLAAVSGAGAESRARVWQAGADEPVTGSIVVDKPGGMTSHDVVARIRRLARTRRVGHGGTLDPMATGVLVLGVGRATRLLTYVIGAAQELRRRPSGSASRRSPTTPRASGRDGDRARAVTDDAIRAGLAALTGEIEQVPSAVSAIKIDGQRAYKRVRDGEAVALAARPGDGLPARRRSAMRRRRRRRVDVDVDVDVLVRARTSGPSPGTSAPRSASAGT